MYSNETELEILNKLKNSLNIPETVDTTGSTFDTTTHSTIDTSTGSTIDASNTFASVNSNKKHGVGYKKTKLSSAELKLLSKFQKPKPNPKKKKIITKNDKTNEKKELKDDVTRLDLIFNKQYQYQ
ncbi:hypothetical protein TpMuguga_03g00472 [Theileria parva strain Muguga]|uniref:Uncharacterized protein n=1 Tax=Theileria parva TaxID=5875 RepID=Q4MZP5_THEPA|nr:uncharacterized protein TpMuguga_03g00472 [Theileria parva strain Muguga]EAN31216.1 hypothetical protein TpMuguga_03g00472 [Theileria parva strain Muguga]|eukprot:XP_763499.1 hypothetical protein [Theileria parva strain Muguga]